MNWLYYLLPTLLEIIKDLQAGNPRFPSKAKVKKAILLALKNGDLKLPEGMSPELFKLLLPVILDVIWGLQNGFREAKRTLKVRK